MSMKLRVVLRREDDWYVVSCPALRGCHSQGRTREEALANIREAIEGWLTAANQGVSAQGVEQLADVEV